jgi:hypothetical protein
MTTQNPGPASTVSPVLRTVSWSNDTGAALLKPDGTHAILSQTNNGVMTPFYSNLGNQDTTLVPVPGQGNFSLVAGTSNNVSIPLPSENLFAFSAALSNAAYWNGSTNLASVTDNAAVDPLGGNSASVVVAGASGIVEFAINSVPLTTGQRYTFAIWVKGVGSSISTSVTLGNFNNGTFQYASMNLQGIWQLLQLSFTPAGTVNNNLFLILNASGTTTFGTVPFNATVNLWGPQLNQGPYRKAYVPTNGAATPVDTSNYQVLGVNTTSSANPIIDFTEQSPGVFFGVPRPPVVQVTSDPTFLLIKGGARRQSSIVIAASDSADPYASDYICTGSADQTAISAAIFSLRGKGGKVLLRAGTYVLNATIVHDADWVILEGETRGFWGAYAGAYPIISIEGLTGGTKLKQTQSGASVIVVGTNLQGNARHQGIGIKNLCLFGYQLTGTAILDTVNTDNSQITDCFIHNFSKGISLGWDTPFISGNSVQSCASDAITVTNAYGAIVKNICYDIGGSGIVVSAAACQIVGNTVGDTGNSGILISGKSNTVVGNTVQNVRVNHCVEINGGVNNAINGNTLSLTYNASGAPGTNANSTGNGIYLHASAINNAITGNTINNINTTASGYAVVLGASGDTTVTGCAVIGNVVTGGKWNAGSTTTILDSSGGSTNKIGMNPGDSHLVGSQ